MEVAKGESARCSSREADGQLDADTYSERITDSEGELLGGETQGSGEGDDREERKDEDERVRLVRKLERPADRQEDQLEKIERDESVSDHEHRPRYPTWLLTMTLSQLEKTTFLAATLQVRPASLASLFLGLSRASLNGILEGTKCSSPLL